MPERYEQFTISPIDNGYIVEGHYWRGKIYCETVKETLDLLGKYLEDDRKNN